MPPHLNHSYIVPPQNWQLTGAFSVRYQCQHPMLVEPTTFHDMSSGLRTNKLAIVTWAVSCSKENQTTSSSRRCCLSYSTFNSDSAIPCPTCACGCPPSPVQTCTASASALPLPSSALMLPFQHRTTIMKAWAELKHIRVPNPTPCGDNCGINIHWHISSDYEQGWIGRVTIFNWESAGIADWFLTMQLDNAAVGIQKSLNYIIGEKVGDNPDKDPRIPGTQQTVIKFTKRRIPSINVLDGDGFPTKVTFNGEECSLPQTLPRPDPRRSAAGIFTALICLFLIIIAVLLCVRILS
ncbi:hypothetical protein F0562_000685 [Nyssa sinensis]|uniref:COBRA C-terminal domain-containing protein n=1 Tax=Nyssa sinensis TaxID=561372 RepID=A0A5J5C5V7_9ASTE|nr:hypothetical protein F0562_000685 [Nyssa sinensis]